MSEEILAGVAGESGKLPLADVPPAPTALPGVGEQLRVAREAKRLSAADVAQTLKLSVRQVKALENDENSGLPGTIVRGFVRNYARVLGLDSDALMRQLDVALIPQPPSEISLGESTKATLPHATHLQRRDLLAISSGLLLVGLAVLAYFFAPQDFWQSQLIHLLRSTEQVHHEPAAEKVDPGPAFPPADQAGSPITQASPEASSPDKGASSSQSSPSVATPAPGLPASGGSLKLSFGRPSWVEIRDNTGQIIFSQLNPAGSEREVEGQAPFTLVIGNASGVTVQYKGKNVELGQRSKDDVARLTLE
jgi:cytoskeleton protein RodZ